MPRGSGPFRLKSHRDYHGRLIYRNESIALALFHLLLAAMFVGFGLSLLCEFGFQWEGLPTLGLYLMVLAGLFNAYRGVIRLFDWQRLVLDPAGGQAALHVRTIRGGETVCCEYGQVRLQLHQVEYQGGRNSWSGHAVVFHLHDKRFVAGQSGSAERAEELAAAVESETGIAWERSPDVIGVGEWDVI